ncbi:uncharacterized protein BXZ73DRAFT_103393 [Epithele typhae]|uniref:uncharacterized protein n=1 Tax=Epithele typhae TaxID=378194 RepID=UPI0020083F1D|nr:uncharacterized protein BXZ73DRAFT_103393 [Epithele typhae]KAH9925015.1 hypothetical protein BXZ73DRAFT_103393 [Epithele typhae]
MLSLVRAASLALVFLSALSAVHANLARAAIARSDALRDLSNGERMARGLGPKPPRRLYSTGTHVARAAPSGVAGTSQSGSIGVYAAGGQFVGYIGAYGITTVPPGSGTASAAWTYSYAMPDPASSVVELNRLGTPFRLSAVAIRSGPQVTLGPGNTIYLQLQNSRATTPAGSPLSTYVYDTYAIGYAQTTVFSVDPSTGLVTVKWVNPDGSMPTTYLAVSGMGLYVTGDLSALASQLGTPVTEVNVYYM